MGILGPEGFWRLLHKLGADFWEVDLDSNFSVFGVRRFTEWPGPLHWIAFPVEILTKPLIHWIPPPFHCKSLFFHWKVLRRIPFPKIDSCINGGSNRKPWIRKLFGCLETQTTQILNWRVPNPPGTNPLVAEGPLEVFAVSCDRGSAA